MSCRGPPSFFCLASCHRHTSSFRFRLFYCVPALHDAAPRRTKPANHCYSQFRRQREKSSSSSRAEGIFTRGYTNARFVRNGARVAPLSEAVSFARSLARIFNQKKFEREIRVVLFVRRSSCSVRMKTVATLVGSRTRFAVYRKVGYNPPVIELYRMFVLQCRKVARDSGPPPGLTRTFSNQAGRYVSFVFVSPLSERTEVFVEVSSEKAGVK